ncbi:MAG: GGDEF domain-containing protein [Gemmatimonadetes bacterium]|nr:GGDEF domain-containing protein [Gemmatimonadota bacterium]
MMRRVLALPARVWTFLQRKRGEFWRPPDPLLVDAGGPGELTVARIRLVVIAFFAFDMLVGLWRDAPTTTTKLETTAAVIAMVIAFGLYLLIKRDRYELWIGFASSILDITLVSAVLVAAVLIGSPQLVVESRVWFVLYILAIAATSLRSDRRISLVAGLLAAAQYVWVLAFAAAHWPADNPPVPIRSHALSLIMMGCAIWISTSLAVRTQRLRLISAKDPLTGLVARGFFLELIEAELYRAKRYGRKVSLALIDVDHFKSFNDNFGHTVGDEVLRLIAKMLRTGRETDLAGRYGGEEFLLMFPETDAAGATKRAEQIRNIIGTSSVTVSIGVAEFPTDGVDLETLIDCADVRLYEAKNAGRNRVVGPRGPVPQGTLRAAFERPTHEYDTIPFETE